MDIGIACLSEEANDNIVFLISRHRRGSTYLMKEKEESFNVLIR
jgi:hypothetical protein